MILEATVRPSTQLYDRKGLSGYETRTFYHFAPIFKAHVAITVDVFLITVFTSMNTIEFVTASFRNYACNIN